MSNECPRSVPLVLNFETRHIAVQWNHLVFDDWFSTVAMNTDNMPHFRAKEWSKVLRTSTFDTQPDDEIKEFAQRQTEVVGLAIEDNTIDERKR